MGAALLLLTACSEGPTAPPVQWTAAELAIIGTLSPVPSPPKSVSNPYADSEKAAILGQKLFFDPRLSADGTVACASCHKPELWFTDGKKTAEGLAVTPRHTPSVIGAAHTPWLFWDGRADSLWAQALGPLENPKEHGTDRMAVMHLVAKHHSAAWSVAFGPLPPLDDSKRFPPHARPVPTDPADPAAKAWALMAPADRTLISELFSKVGKAIAAYERKIVLEPAPFDRFVAALNAGDQTGGGHLSLPAQRGLRLFVDPNVGCTFCHAGPRMTRDLFFNIGVPQPTWSPEADRGRYDGGSSVLQDEFNCFGPYADLAAGDQSTACSQLFYLDPGASGTVGAFKVPTLRNVEKTAPYMHAGQLASLADVIDHYNEVSQHHASIGIKEPFLEDLHLSPQQRSDLVRFLRSLTSPAPSGPWATAPEETP